jgi:hypothetical protein
VVISPVRTGVEAAFDIIARDALDKMLGTDKKNAPPKVENSQKVNLHAPPRKDAPQRKWKFC